MAESDENFNVSDLIDEEGDDSPPSQGSTVSEEEPDTEPEEYTEVPPRQRTPEAPSGSKDMEAGKEEESEQVDTEDVEGVVSQGDQFHTIENEVGEEITVSSDAYNLIDHLKSQIQSKEKEINRLNTQVQRLNKSSSIGRR